MAKIRYRSFEHVERLEDSKVDVRDYLNDDMIHVFPKMDGTCSCVWASDGVVHCGARHREVSVEKDNADFCKYITCSDDEMIAKLRKFCLDNEGLIVYGEFLGHVEQHNGFIGSIKYYITGGFRVFAVFDTSHGYYLPYEMYAKMFDECGYDGYLKPLAVLNHPDVTDIQKLVGENHFDVPDGKVGEGVVIYNYGYRRKYDSCQLICKIVRDDYRTEKAKAKRIYADGELEEEFVDKYMTPAFLDKCRNKVRLACDAEEFDNGNKKHVGMFMSLAVSDLIDEETYSFVKSKRFPTINFGVVKRLAQEAAREFLGL